MSVVRANIGRIRVAFGTFAIAGFFLAAWFSVLFQPLIYCMVVALFASWIGLWPFRVPNIGSRLLIACAGSVGVCIVLLVIGEAVAFVRQDGQEEFGPLLFVPAFMVVMGLPLTVLAGIVAVIAPRIRARG